MVQSNGKHILYISKWYPSASDSMLGLFVKNHAKAGIAGGYKISVAYISPINTLKSDDRPAGVNISEEGNLSEHVFYFKPYKFFRIISYAAAWYKAIKSVIKNNGKPDLIHAHILTRTALIAYILSVYYKVPFIITEHWSRYLPENLSYRGIHRKLLTKFVISKASEVTVVSERLYDSMSAQGLSFKKNILPNAIDTELFKINNTRNTVFRFVSITCFENKSKNLKLLLSAASRLQKAGKEFELLMIGDGSDYTAIQHYARTLEVNAIFTGTLSPKETAKMLSMSHCLVLSSNYETFAIVVYEALSCGIPVITTDVADLKKTINEQCGKVIPSGNEDALFNAMSSMIDEYSKYKTEHLREVARNQSSYEVVTLKLSEIYNKLTD